MLVLAKQYIYIYPHKQDFYSQSFTYIMWLHLMSDAGYDACAAYKTAYPQRVESYCNMHL